MAILLCGFIRHLQLQPMMSTLVNAINVAALHSALLCGCKTLILFSHLTQQLFLHCL